MDGGQFIPSTPSIAAGYFHGSDKNAVIQYPSRPGMKNYFHN
jgi:hypothetical protein